MIPKRLHFTWKTADLPPVLKRYYDSFVRLHPGWEIVLWTDASMRAFMAETYPALLPIYDAYPRNIQRADFFRYAVLHAQGGVYSDLDVEAHAPIDPLLALDCFVGVEPFEHVGDHRRQAGIGYLLSNAFMGSVPGHPFWREILDLAPVVAANSGDVFQSTGPFLVLAAALRVRAEDRPVGLLAEVWSPTRDGGGQTHTSAAQVALVERKFRTYRGEGTALVSHKWLTTWASWTDKHQHIIDRLHPNRLKWWLRSKRYPAIANMRLPITRAVYDDQRLETTRTEATVWIGLHLPDGRTWNPAIAAALAGLDYPRGQLSVALYGPGEASPAPGLAATFGTGYRRVDTTLIGAAVHNLILIDGAAAADRVLLIDGSLRTIPAGALTALLNSGPEVITATLPNSDRPEAYRYGHRLNFRNLYKAGALSGVLSPDRGGRHEPREWPAFRLLPVDGLSARFLLIDSVAVRAGLRFAETPYKLHLDGEGLALMAKDMGYEAAIRNDILVA